MKIGFIIHNNTILQVKVIIFESFLQMEKLLVLITLRYYNDRLFVKNIIYQFNKGSLMPYLKKINNKYFFFLYKFFNSMKLICNSYYILLYKAFMFNLLFNFMYYFVYKINISFEFYFYGSVLYL